MGVGSQQVTAPSARAAVVVPAYREALEADEEVSLRHLRRFLAPYDKYLLAPEGLRLSLPDFRERRFPGRFFRDTNTYSALLISREFYEAFADYDYVLIYQLDALVFSDALDEWCRAGLDYVGAPWFPGDPGVDFVSEPRVGNGGFSLRRVESFLRVTGAPGFGRELDKYRDAFFASMPVGEKLLNLPGKIARRLGLPGAGGRAILNRARGGPPPAAERLNEDCFWSFKAVEYDPSFRVASVEEGLRFAFETNPRRSFELNGRRLPFGCHAWAKYDREFWEPFLIK